MRSSVKAAEETDRSRSSVSYNLTLLQERLDVALLAPPGRRTVSTSTGKLLLNQAKPPLQVFAYVEIRAATLRNGAHIRLDLIVDSIFPRQRLFAIPCQFQQRYPQTQVRLTGMPGDVDNESAAQIETDVMMLTCRQDTAGRGEWLMNIDFIAAARRGHPPATLDGPLEDSMLVPWPLVRIADQAGDGQATCDVWIFPTIGVAIDTVMYQVEFGWLLEKHIRPRLDQDMPKRLSLSHDVRRTTPPYLVVRRDLTPTDEQVATLPDLFWVP